jgi:hypothetical protein
MTKTIQWYIISYEDFLTNLLSSEFTYRACHCKDLHPAITARFVVFRVDNSDTIQGRNSGCDSEGVNHEKTVNHNSEFNMAELRYQLKISTYSNMCLNTEFFSKLHSYHP